MAQVNKKGFCPDCGCRLRYDPLPKDPDFFALCEDCGSKVREEQIEAVKQNGH